MESEDFNLGQEVRSKFHTGVSGVVVGIYTDFNGVAYNVEWQSGDGKLEKQYFSGRELRQA